MSRLEDLRVREARTTTLASPSPRARATSVTRARCPARLTARRSRSAPRAWRVTRSPRGWTRPRGAGAGGDWCSTSFDAPAWQLSPRREDPSGTTCTRRTVADVAVVGDPATGVAVYDSYSSAGGDNWYEFGGTSVGAPSWPPAAPARRRSPDPAYPYPARHLYEQRAALHDITSGSNGDPVQRLLADGAGPVLPVPRAGRLRRTDRPGHAERPRRVLRSRRSPGRGRGSHASGAIRPGRPRPARPAGLDALDGPEDDLAVLDVDDDRLAGAELLPQELLRQRVLDQALDGAAERPGAERRVVALARRAASSRPSVSSMSMSWPSAGRAPGVIIRSTIFFTSSCVSEWNTMTSSIRFRNSGRKLFLSSSFTRSRICS